MSDRPVLYLLSGLLCDNTVWDAQAAELADIVDVRVRSFLRFHSIVDMAAFVLEDAPARFSIAGHSMGGRVALEAYRMAGSRIERLALLDTGSHPVNNAEIAPRKARVELAYTKGLAALADVWLPPMVKPGRLKADPALADRLISMVGRATPDQHAGQIHALLERPDATDVLPTIACPTMLLSGSDDGWSPVADHAAMMARVPTAFLAVIEDSGHMTMNERPAAVTAALRYWLTAPLAAFDHTQRSF